jgi:prepilin signal peptidase PulO-like enzyme (type II secretory pathway)
VDVVEVWLIVWLLREMPPVRFAARYLVIPLVTVLESFVLMRPEWTVRMVFGTFLLAAGAGALLFWKVAEEETVLSLR